MNTRTPARNESPADIQVMLVDDHPLMRAGVKELLNAEPRLRVIAEAADGPSAIRLAQKFSPHVIVMDVSLPGLSGAEVTKLILQEETSTRVLALSAHEEPAFARMLLDAGASGYALKRSAGEELVRAVRTVAEGGTYLDPSLARALVGTQRRHSPRGVPVLALSDREEEVIRLIAQGHTSKEVAQRLGLSPRTLETYKVRAMTKLELHSRADLVRYAASSGWLRDS